MSEWHRLAGARPTKEEAKHLADYWKRLGYKIRFHKEVDKLPRYRRDKRGRLVLSKREHFLWYIELRLPKGVIPSRHARKRARIVGSVGLKQTRKVRERG